MSAPQITITLTDAEWIRLTVVIKVMSDMATTNAGASILADLGLKILDQVQPQLGHAGQPVNE